MSYDLKTKLRYCECYSLYFDFDRNPESRRGLGMRSMVENLKVPVSVKVQNKENMWPILYDELVVSWKQNLRSFAWRLNWNWSWSIFFWSWQRFRKAGEQHGGNVIIQRGNKEIWQIWSFYLKVLVVESEILYPVWYFMSSNLETYGIKQLSTKKSWWW